MKNGLSSAAFLSASIFSALLFLLGICAPATAADGSEQSARDADQALLAALAKPDRAGAEKMLDTDFVWTDTEGKSLKKSEVLNALLSYAADNQNEGSVETHFYGEMETVLGVHHNARFLRVWVKRPTGWREYIELDTPITPGAPPRSIEAGAGRGDCENPCRTVPYTPTTAMDKAILADWQKTKMEEWHPDAADWATHIADEFLIINNSNIRNKEERVAIAQKQERAGAGTPGDPITAMEIHDFGDNGALMVSHHIPHRGGKPYYNVRVWTLRDGRWQLAVSQQTTIQSAAPVPAADLK
jgi:hypothetical protein